MNAEPKNNDIVFRRIRGRIVPMKRKKHEQARPSLEKSIQKASLTAGGVGSASYAGFDTVRRWLQGKREAIDKEIAPIRASRPDPFKRVKPKPAWDDAPGLSTYHMDQSPLAKKSRQSFDETLKSFKSASRQSKKAWGKYYKEAKPLLQGRGGLRFRRFQLSSYQKIVSSKMIPAAIVIGAAAGAGALLYDQFGGGK